MPGPDPTARRRRIALLVAPAALALGVVAGTGASGAQVPPLLTTTTSEPTPETTTTEAPAETTTTEAPAETTTTQRSTPPSRATTTTTAEEDDDEVVDDVVIEDGGAEEVDDGSDVTEPAPTSSTLRDLLVPGDGTDGAESTTTTSTTVAEGDEDGVDEETQVWLIVAGLVAVAVLIGAWTVRYWRRTQPERPDDPGPEPDQTTVFGTP